MTDVSPFQIDSIDHVERLVFARVPEGPTLEYKALLALGSRGERLEALKDLTGMGNGGGGVVLFGVAESDADSELPDHIEWLTSRADVGVLEDFVRSGIQPPLLWRPKVLEGSEGFVLAAEVLRSPLGPYMVQAYGERRYHVRIGTRTTPMTEQQVRDAYLLAARTEAGRRDEWVRLDLPLDLGPADVSLAVSGIPRGPLVDVLDLRSHDADRYRVTDQNVRVPAMHARNARLVDATRNVRVWAGGLFCDDSTNSEQPRVAFRLHPHGAAAIGCMLWADLGQWVVPRVLNAQLSYLGWTWEQHGVVGPIELDIRIGHLEYAKLVLDRRGFPNQRPVVTPSVAPEPQVALRVDVMPHELGAPAHRHRIVRLFSDRFYQAFGLQAAVAMFTTGKLYRTDWISLSLSGGGIFDGRGRQVASVDDRGAVRSTTDSTIKAWAIDGLLMDLGGDALGAVELAPSRGVPYDFRPSRVDDDPRALVDGGRAPDAPRADHDEAHPQPTGNWSASSPTDVLGTNR